MMDHLTADQLAVMPRPAPLFTSNLAGLPILPLARLSRGRPCRRDTRIIAQDVPAGLLVYVAVRDRRGEDVYTLARVERMGAASADVWLLGERRMLRRVDVERLHLWLGAA